MLCKSIKMQVLLSIAFGIAELFPILATGTPNNDTCVIAISGIACYLKGSEELVDWNTAKQACNSSHSTLPVIRNKNDQDDLAGYLKSQKTIISAWTAGKIFSYTGWTWVNEEKLNENVPVHLSDDEPSGLEEAHIALYYTGTDLKFVKQHDSQELPYICQRMDARCKPSSKIRIHSECISMFNDNRAWYDARNQCLMTGLDLAVINDDVHGYLKEHLKLNQSYWIGLRKTSFRWAVNDGRSDDEVKYTNWDSHAYSTYGECIFVDGSDGNWKWKARRCTQQIAAAVCQRVALDESTTGGPQAATEQIVCEERLSTDVDQEAESVSYTTFMAVVTVGICVIIISNILVALAVRKCVHNSAHLNSSLQVASSRENPPADRCYQDLETIRRQDNPDSSYTELKLQPIYD